MNKIVMASPSIFRAVNIIRITIRLELGIDGIASVDTDVKTLK